MRRSFDTEIMAKVAKSIGEKERVIDELYRQIGQLKVENEWEFLPLVKGNSPLNSPFLTRRT